MIISYLCITKWIEAILDISRKSMSHLILHIHYLSAVSVNRNSGRNVEEKLKIMYSSQN
jgi:hypothetical protein